MLRTRQWDTQRIADEVARALAERRILHVYELARMASISDAHLSRILHGKTSPSDPVVLRIARALGVDPETFLSEDHAS